MHSKAFTLIELLIVVAIIAILAAIAVPNFLEAQTRAKVSRAKSDLRTLATAIEAYNVDYNKPCPQSSTNGQGPFSPITVGSSTGTGTLTYAITTPVAYITSFMILDPFVSASDVNINIDERLFTYQSAQWIYDQPDAWVTPAPPPVIIDSFNDQCNRNQFTTMYGRWRLASIGPDRTYYNRVPKGSVPFPVGVPYDPTNGTVSIGNIIRSQVSSEQKTWKIVP